MFAKIKQGLKKWYVLAFISISITLYFLHYFEWRYDPIILLKAGYVEGVVLDNATLPDCHWDNKVYGDGNSCDRHGDFEIVLDDGTHASVHIWQLDHTRAYIRFPLPKRCYGSISGFPLKKPDPSAAPIDPSDKLALLKEALKVKYEVHPGDRIRVYGKKSVNWVRKTNSGILVITSKNDKNSYQYTDYYNCDSAFFYAEKIN